MESAPGMVSRRINPFLEICYPTYFPPDLATLLTSLNASESCSSSA